MVLHPHARLRLIRWLLLFVLLAMGVAGVVWWRQTKTVDSAPNSQTFTVQTDKNSSAVSPGTKSIDKSQYSINDPTSIWAIVNKGRILPTNYSPVVVTPNVPLNYATSSNDSHLRAETAHALEAMFTDAKKAGFSLKLFSGYRSYGEQVSVYNNFVSSQGQAHADISSARPGHSEHQTGLAADVSTVGGSCELEQCYGDTPAGQWLSVNADKYGFVIRYPKGSENLTGYEFEPWHLRFVGTELAAAIKQNGQTLEQFFNLAAYPDYPATSYELKSGL